MDGEFPRTSRKIENLSGSAPYDMNKLGYFRFFFTIGGLWECSDRIVAFRTLLPHLCATLNPPVNSKWIKFASSDSIDYCRSARRIFLEPRETAFRRRPRVADRHIQWSEERCAVSPHLVLPLWRARNHMWALWCPASCRFPR